MKRKILLHFLSIVGFAPLFASSPAEYKEGDMYLSCLNHLKLH